MSVIETHETAPTRFIEANGIRYAYRRFGRSPASRWCSTTLPRHDGQLGSADHLRLRPGSSRRTVR